MEVIQIVEEHLKHKGYTGLYSYYCGCTVDDLAPCGNILRDCKSGYKHIHSVSGEYVIAKQKKPLSDDAIDALLES